MRVREGADLRTRANALVRRSGHRSLKAVAPVRIRSGLRVNAQVSGLGVSFGSCALAILTAF